MMLHAYGAPDHMLFVTDQIDAQVHRHSFLQLSVSLGAPFLIEVDGTQYSSRGILLGSHAPHRFFGSEQKLLFLLIDCTSNLAKPFRKLVYNKSTHFLTEQEISGICRPFEEKRDLPPDRADYYAFLEEFLRLFGIEASRHTPVDPRIAKLMLDLKSGTAANDTVALLAKEAGLSTRLSHLFKAQMGVPLNSYLVMGKLQKAFYLILRGMDITTAALEAGFDSPSHLAATSKRLLGMSAREIRKDSVFLKVSYIPEW